MSPLKKILLICLLINIFCLFWYYFYSMLLSYYTNINVNIISCKIDIINTGCYIMDEKSDKKWFTDPCLFTSENENCYSISNNNIPLSHRYYIENISMSIYMIFFTFLHIFLVLIVTCLLYHVYLSIDIQNYMDNKMVELW